MAFTITLVFLALLPILQKKESTAPLKETIDWLANFSKQHGFLMVNSQPILLTRISPVDGCVIKVEHWYLSGPRSGNQIKNRASTINLADFDPDNIKTNVADHSEDHDTFEVTFERSDAAIKIEDDVENWDGGKSKLYFSSESVIMDSDESARRIAPALSHAIRLCGGKRAPF